MSAQKVKIKKILDSNLFELTDGRLIKLAGIDVPNINHKDTSLQQVGIDAYKYAKLMLLEKRFELTYSNKIPLNKNFTLVQIIKDYPLLTRDFTKEYLGKGFGKLLNNVDTSYYQKYLSAENKAKKDKEGIWEFENNYDKNTLDQTFLGAKLLTENSADSIKIYPLSKPFIVNATPIEKILLETIAAPVMGSISFFGGGLVGFGIGTLLYGTDHGHGLTAAGVFALVGGYIGYTIGSALGVQYIAKNGNRDVTLGYTILSSFIGAGVGFAILHGNRDDFWASSIRSYAPLILPGVASIIYVNFIAPQKEVKLNISKTNVKELYLINENLTHNDYYNSTKLLEVNLFRIYF